MDGSVTRLKVADGAKFPAMADVDRLCERFITTGTDVRSPTLVSPTGLEPALERF